ncbi:glycoside hydrolase family 105 protein [Oceanobacillus sp. FSL H7-0719]|uniref:glycoside hydrolase family 88/105 protein n=1 Tax=Oceanobacillus sp. FSL H7-0719 TaxID=2954507 RepID=UPI003250D1B3
MENQLHFNGKSPLEWAVAASQTLMEQYEPNKLPPENRWHYHQGVFLCGLLDVWKETKEKEYYYYVKEYVDKLVDKEGNFIFRRSELDAIQPGLLLLPLYEETNDNRYKAAATKLRNLLDTLNKTSEGGFWHKDNYPYQMWLDGLYMAGPFMITFGQMFQEPELTDLVMHQEELMRRYTKDDMTGLYFHGWDEKKQQSWAAKNGHAPEIWGRALGWYAMTVVNFIELLPVSHHKHDILIQVIRDLFVNLRDYQDEETGLWYQVVNKGHLNDNWLESSSSCLFVYAMAKAVRKGYVNEEYLDAARKAYEGIIKNNVIIDKKDNLTLTGISIGTSIGEYDYYINRETSNNDLHGVGAFILASVQMQQHVKKE